MKILITNIVTLNAGDAAILYAMIDVLRAAFAGNDIQFIVYDKHGNAPSRYYPELEFRKLLYLSREADNRGSDLLRRFSEIRFKLGLWSIKHNAPLLPHIFLTETERRDVLEYKTADLIVSSGGTYLVENYSLEARIFDYRLSLALGRPLVFFTQSLGPFANESNRRSLLPIFNNALLILLRDEQSRRNLIDLGVKNQHVHRAADAAFALSDSAALAAAKLPTKTVNYPLRIAISVREWRHFKTVDAQAGMERYCKAVQALTRHLVDEHEAQITFISSCQGMPEYWTDDSTLARSIVNGLKDDIRVSVSVDGNFHNPAALTKILKNHDLLVATRMHMAILALGVGTPVLPISYEFKIRELFDRLGQSEWVQDIETISGKDLIESANRFLEQLPQMRLPLFSAVERESKNAIASGELVREAFERWQQRANN